MSDNSEPRHLSANEAMICLRGILQERRAALRNGARFAFALSEGHRFIIDPSTPELLSQDWVDDSEVTILTNSRTLSDLVLGKLEAEAPQSYHMFYFSGDEGALKALQQAFGGAKSWLSVRAQG